MYETRGFSGMNCTMAFTVGALIGGAIALLTAPRTGRTLPRRTRQGAAPHSPVPAPHIRIMSGCGEKVSISRRRSLV